MIEFHYLLEDERYIEEFLASQRRRLTEPLPGIVRACSPRVASPS